MRAKLEFDTTDEEDSREFKRCVNATNAYSVIQAIAHDIFRPYRKHGYQDFKIQKMIDNCPTFKDADGDETDHCSEIISLLEDKFYELLSDYNIDLSDL